MEINAVGAQAEPAKQEYRRKGDRVIFKKEDFQTIVDIGRKIEEQEMYSMQRKGSAATAEVHQVFTGVKFEEIITNAHILRNLKGLSYLKLTEIQLYAIAKIAKTRNDCIIKAPTGSGKSLAAYLPLAYYYFQEKRALRVLVISPTRELSYQSAELMQKLLVGSYCVVSQLSGGASREKEKAVLRRGSCMLFCTLGRLLDHLEKTDSLKSAFAQIKDVVLDECDYLLEQGCANQISAVLARLRGARKIFMSATINQQLLALVNRQMIDPQLLQADADADTTVEYALPSELTQEFTVVPCKARLAVLFCCLSRIFAEQLKTMPELRESDTSDSEDEIVAKKPREPASDAPALYSVLIFTSSRASVDFLLETAKRLQKTVGHFLPKYLYQLHGGMDQEARTAVFSRFKRTGGLMFATDIAARGLNLSDDNSGVSVVVQYDTPSSVRQYVHRAGRAGRAGNTGSSILFLMPSEAEFVKSIVENTRRRIAHVSCDLLGLVLGFRIGVRAFEKIQTEIESFAREDEVYKQLASTAFVHFMSAYSARDVDVRSIFQSGALHSGHIAKSFGLQDAPTTIARQMSQKTAEHRYKAPGALVKKSSRRGTKVQRGEYDDRYIM